MANPTPLNSHELTAVRALVASDGWVLLTQRMQAEMQAFASQLASNPAMPDSELHWRRGVLWCAERMLRMPTLFIQQLENEALLAAATAAAKSPATAGQGEPE